MRGITIICLAAVAAATTTASSQGAAPPDSADASAWFQRGLSHHRAGDFEGALAAFAHAASLGPHPFAVYDAAAASARLGRADESFRWLDSAVVLGFRSATTLEGDSDFVSLRGDARFAPMLERMRRAFTPCAYEPKAHALDFWAGDWEVRSAQGQVVGKSHVEPVSGGCALLESWTDGMGGTGRSLSAYNPERGAWQQFWVGQYGDVTEYRESEWSDGRVALVAQETLPDGRALRRRMTFTRLPDGAVRQAFELSRDGGRTWATAGRPLTYRKPGGG
jgi:hypothetical protein